MRDKARHENEIHIAFAKDLVGDVQVTIPGIPGSAWFYCHYAVWLDGVRIIPAFTRASCHCPARHESPERNNCRPVVFGSNSGWLLRETAFNPPRPNSPCLRGHIHSQAYPAGCPQLVTEDRLSHYLPDTVFDGGWGNEKTYQTAGHFILRSSD